MMNSCTTKYSTYFQSFTDRPEQNGTTKKPAKCKEFKVVLHSIYLCTEKKMRNV